MPLLRPDSLISLTLCYQPIAKGQVFLERTGLPELAASTCAKHVKSGGPDKRPYITDSMLYRFCSWISSLDTCRSCKNSGVSCWMVFDRNTLVEVGLMHSNIIIRSAQERARFRARDKNIGAVNPLSIAAHKAAYAHGGPWLEQLKAYIDGNLALVDTFLKENIPDARFTIPEATYFAWVDLGDVLPRVEDLPDFFANKAGVLLEGGNDLFAGNAKGYIRLNLAMPRATVQTGLERIAAAIHAQQAEA